ncbi:MAG: vitamin B12 ABC transporter permease BtuC [Vibrionaceae bacterium]
MSFFLLIEQSRRRWLCVIFAALLLTITLFFAALLIGEITFNPFNLEPLHVELLTTLRLPRALAAILVGAALAVCGGALQVLLGNPLAEPGILGISSGATLALVALFFCFPLQITAFSTMLTAMLGAVIFTGALVWVSRKWRLSTARLLLMGMCFSILSSALVTWAFYFSNELHLRQLIYWLMGSLSGVGWPQLSLSIVMLPVLFAMILQAKQLDLLMLGETQAMLRGQNSAALRTKLILMISLLIGASTAMAGIIGFVGLIVPHFLRLWLGCDNRYLLPLSALVGASLLLLADIIARTALIAAELPVGAVTTVIGAPLFIWILLKRAC